MILLLEFFFESFFLFVKHNYLREHDTHMDWLESLFFLPIYNKKLIDVGSFEKSA